MRSPILFKNLYFYQLTQPAAGYIDALKHNADDHAFEPCGPVDSRSIGFAPLYPEILDDCVASLGELTFFAIRVQEKKIPPQALRELVSAKVAEIEKKEQRKIYRKERKLIELDIIAITLPKMPPASRITMGYIDPLNDIVAIAVSSASKAEEALGFLRHACGSFPVKPISPTGNPSLIMSGWLKDSTFVPAGVALSDEAKLRQLSDKSEAITLKNTQLETDAVENMIESGMVVERLRCFYRQIEFTVTDDCARLLRINWPDRDPQTVDEMELLQVIESDAFILCEEMRSILVMVGAAFGGWIKQSNLELDQAQSSTAQ
ncbi:MAG: recombination-associated protein RdgC [Gammaproteobacteria bacterium]